MRYYGYSVDVLSFSTFSGTFWPTSVSDKKLSISMFPRKDFKQKIIGVIFLEVGNQIQMEPTSNLAKQSQKLEMHEKGGVHGT